MADELHPLAIPEFLKVKPGDENRPRPAAKPIPASSAESDWRAERNKAYNEAARKDPSSGDHEQKP